MNTRHIAWIAALATVFLAPLTGADLAAVPLERLLDETGARVGTFWEQVGSVSCLESVWQAKYNQDRKVISQKRESYLYLMLLQMSGDRLTAEESRELQGKAARQSAQPLLSTGGFSVLTLIFHPHYQGGFVFRDLPPGPGGERLVAFEALPGAPSPSAIVLKDREYPIAWKGTAAIDPETGMVRRIQAELAAPMEDVGLRALNADVRYEPVAFKNPPDNFWLPRSATVEAMTRKQHWRNVHQFSEYKRFSVSTGSTVGHVR
jgi:hypothetical protein